MSHSKASQAHSPFMEPSLAHSRAPHVALRNGYGFLLAACALSGLGSFFAAVPTVPAWLVAGACATTFAWRLAPVSPHFRNAGVLWFFGTLGSLIDLLLDAVPPSAMAGWLLVETCALFLLLLGIRQHALLLGAPRLAGWASATRLVVVLSGLSFVIGALAGYAEDERWWQLIAYGLLFLTLGPLAALTAGMHQLLGHREVLEHD